MWHQAETWSKVILLINEKQYFPHFYKKIVGGGGEGGLRVVCKQHSKNNAYSKNNVIVFFYKQKNFLSPFVQPPPFKTLTFLFLLTVLYPSPYSPFSESLPLPLSLPLTKGRR